MKQYKGKLLRIPSAERKFKIDSAAKSSQRPPSQVSQLISP